MKDKSYHSGSYLVRMERNCRKSLRPIKYAHQRAKYGVSEHDAFSLFKKYFGDLWD